MEVTYKVFKKAGGKVEVRHFSIHITGLGTKRDVTARTTGSKFSDGTGQKSAVSHCGFIIKIFDE